MTTRHPITFLPSDVTVWVDAGETVLAAARLAGITLAAPCGGKGRCGACGVRVAAGHLADPDEIESGILSQLPAGIRLACRARVCQMVTVSPLSSARGTSITARSSNRLVAGVDLGTTNVLAEVVDAETGAFVGRASLPNPQQSWGGDVLSRLSAAIAGEGDALRHAAEHAVLDVMAAASGGEADRLSAVVIAGNTSMAALLCGADVGTLGVAPFTAPTTLRIADAAPLAAAWPNAVIDVLPAIASFVGGDTVAALHATGMLDSPQPAALIDVGTNAEIAVWDGSRLFVASAAAGPAFEGAGIHSGGPAVPGAVTRVALDGTHLRVDTIEGGDPLWFCGAGVLSAIALLLREGHVDSSGRIVREGPLVGRHGRDDDGVEYFDLSTGPHDVRLTQLDIRSIQLAKAAIRIAFDAVLERAGLESSELAHVHLCGAFGGGVDSDDVFVTGLLPRSVEPVLSTFGSAALTGAVGLAFDPSRRARLVEVVEQAHAVELATTGGFTAGLIERLAFTA